MQVDTAYVRTVGLYRYPCWWCSVQTTANKAKW